MTVALRMQGSGLTPHAHDCLRRDLVRRRTGSHPAEGTELYLPATGHLITAMAPSPDGWICDHAGTPIIVCTVEFETALTTAQLLGEGFKSTAAWRARAAQLLGSRDQVAQRLFSIATEDRIAVVLDGRAVAHLASIAPPRRSAGVAVAIDDMMRLGLLERLHSIDGSPMIPSEPVWPHAHGTYRLTTP